MLSICPGEYKDCVLGRNVETTLYILHFLALCPTCRGRITLKNLSQTFLIFYLEFWLGTGMFVFIYLHMTDFKFISSTKNKLFSIYSLFFNFNVCISFFFIP